MKPPYYTCTCIGAIALPFLNANLWIIDQEWEEKGYIMHFPDMLSESSWALLHFFSLWFPETKVE